MQNCTTRRFYLSDAQFRAFTQNKLRKQSRERFSNEQPVGREIVIKSARVDCLHFCRMSAVETEAGQSRELFGTLCAASPT